MGGFLLVTLEINHKAFIVTINTVVITSQLFELVDIPIYLNSSLNVTDASETVKLGNEQSIQSTCH